MTKTQLTVGGSLFGLFAGALAGYGMGCILYHDACGVVKGPMIILSSFVGIPIGGVVFGLLGYWRGRLAGQNAILGRRHFSCPECGGAIAVSWFNGIVKDCPHCRTVVRISDAGQKPRGPVA